MNIMHAILGQTFWVDYNNNSASLGPSLCAWSLDPFSLIEQEVINVFCYIHKYI